MNQISETGHAMNVINFQSLLTFIDSLGDLYNPSRECIKRESLQTLLENTQESFNSLYIAQSNYTLAVDDRIDKSTSQMSYNSRLENFEWFIIFLSKTPEYNPNEEDLKIESLKTLHSDLKAKNNLVMTAHSKMETERTQRNKMLYQPLTGIVDISIDIKNYIKSLFGASSHQYKQISKLHFKVRL